MKLEQTVCDVCGAEKREVNHWFSITPEIDDDGQIVISRQFDDIDDVHICGRACLHKYVDRFLNIPMEDNQC